MFWYNGLNSTLDWSGWITSPSLLPRVSVSGDGSRAMIGWAQYDKNFNTVARYPNVVASKNSTGHAWDSINNLSTRSPDAAMATGTPWPAPIRRRRSRPPCRLCKSWMRTT
jgi:hypothetical protein